ALDRQRRREQRSQASVGGGSTLYRVHELRDAVTPVDEAEKQLEIGDERSDCHGPDHDALASLPDDQDDARDHQGRVDRLEPALEAGEAQVPSGHFGGKAGDAVARRGDATEQAEHADSPRYSWIA